METIGNVGNRVFHIENNAIQQIEREPSLFHIETKQYNKLEKKIQILQKSIDVKTPRVLVLDIFPFLQNVHFQNVGSSFVEKKRVAASQYGIFLENAFTLHIF